MQVNVEMLQNTKGRIFTTWVQINNLGIQNTV